jgi:hypothetical protein
MVLLAEIVAGRDRITANHFALIRSFLIESDAFRRLRAPSVQKFSLRRHACFERRQRKT